MDTAKWALHPCSTQPDAVMPMLARRCRIFVFFFFNGVTPTRLQFSPNQANSARIRSYRPDRSISTNGRNWSKQAEIDLESYQNNQDWLWMMPKHPKSVLPQFYFKYLLLLLCSLFCFVFLAFFFLCFMNQWHIMCFLRIFLKARICVKTQELFRPLLRAICGSPVERKAQWWGPQEINCVNSKKDH